MMAVKEVEGEGVTGGSCTAATRVVEGQDGRLGGELAVRASLDVVSSGRRRRRVLVVVARDLLVHVRGRSATRQWIRGRGAARGRMGVTVLAVFTVILVVAVLVILWSVA